MLHLPATGSGSVLLPWVFVGVIAIFILRNYFNKGLNKYPAPSFAAFTNLWRLLAVARRQAQFEYLRLHEKLGDVVRLGPNALSFSNPKAVKIIYGLSNKLPKVEYPEFPSNSHVDHCLE